MYLRGSKTPLTVGTVYDLNLYIHFDEGHHVLNLKMVSSVNQWLRRRFSEAL